MARSARMILENQEKPVYHVMTKTCLPGLPFGDVEKDEIFKIIKRISGLYFTEVLGVCIMGSHFHLLIKMLPEYNYSDDDIKKRYIKFYGKDNEKKFSDGHVAYYRKKWEKLSEYMKDIKQDI